jgi:hypothetical protein
LGGFDKPSKIKALERRFSTGQDWYNKENGVNFLRNRTLCKSKRNGGFSNLFRNFNVGKKIEKRRRHQMKALKWMAFFFIILLLPISSYAALDIMRISLLEGDVQVYTEETGEWVPAAINMPVKEGDRIWAADRGRVEMQFKDGTYLRLDQKSALEILTAEKDSYQLHLSAGHLFANYRGKDDAVLQIDTPESSIRAYEKSKFRVDVFDSGRTEITNFRGTIQAESREGRTRIERGRTLYITERGDAEFGPLPPADEWEKWNRQRDTKLAEWRPPAKYLPEDLRGYSRDFDDNGRWVYVEEHGHVWTPNVVVSVGWAPYRLGRWVWVGGNYTWISYEPWGWAPYHYGRWAFTASVGWCWVPPVRGAVHWGPGYVGWVVTPTHVSWVPLAPREIYYGRGHHGPHSVNITQVNVTNVNVEKVVYKNVQVTNSVTVVHRDTFVTGRHVDVKAQENPFLRERVHVGQPDIQPQRATKMPVVREVPVEKRPPAPIREVKVREIKESRPLVREKEASVLKPGAPPREMQVKVREGTPEARAPEKPGQPAPARRDLEKPAKAKAPAREIEKPQPGKAAEKATAKPQARPQAEVKIEKPGAVQPAERGVEKSRPVQPVQRAVEKPKPASPAEKAVEKPTPSRTPEKGTERPAAPRSPQKESVRPKPVDKEVEKAPESRQMERGGQGGEGKGR